MTTAVQLDRPMRAVTAPAAIVVNAPIESRVSFIGNVNDMSPDAATYSGHTDRNRTPATAGRSEPHHQSANHADNVLSHRTLLSIEVDWSAHPAAAHRLGRT